VNAGAPPMIWTMAGLLVLIEAIIAASDAGYLPPGLRYVAYSHFAFDDRFFEAARSGQEVPLGFYATFFTHAFLHGGFAHLLMNTVVFLALGSHLCRAVGERATLMLFFGTAAAGALLFGLIVNTGTAFVPMVGCSGALFGFLGAMKRWEWRYVTANRLPTRRFWSTILALTLINIILALGTIGGAGVAWEAHLGGFIAGWIAAGALTPRRGAAIGPI
jgi:membrane associated rhomboid family serine protease